MSTEKPTSGILKWQPKSFKTEHQCKLPSIFWRRLGIGDVYRCTECKLVWMVNVDRVWTVVEINVWKARGGKE